MKPRVAAMKSWLLMAAVISCAPAPSVDATPTVDVAPQSSAVPAAVASGSAAPSDPALRLGPTKTVRFQGVGIDVPVSWGAAPDGQWAQGSEGAARLHDALTKGELKTETAAQRAIAILDASEHGMQGLLKTDGPTLLDPEPPASQEVTSLGGDWLVKERCADHVHFKVLRRVGEGWVMAHVKGGTQHEGRLREIAVSLRPIGR